MKNKKLAIYLAILYVLSAFCYVSSYLLYTKKYHAQLANISFSDIIIFIFLSAIAESFVVKYKNVGISPGFGITTAATLHFGVFWGMVIVSIGTTLRCVRFQGKTNHLFNTPVYKTLYNISNYSISTYLGGIVFHFILNRNYTTYPIYIFVQYISFVILFLMVNTLIISILVVILSQTNFFDIFSYHLRIGFLNIVYASPFGILLLFLYNSNNILGILVTLLVIITSRYIFKLYLLD
ncbi:hypothetical protein [Fonticella tunisiensis]|uniref:Uncharacterized protein n=1 Tax=Fonticella tunisiensis TaxID=1096341 RepID=A0A4R7KB33_9CLOT|nr:hypothetical protein [Fonticella tunisiensis]TDT51080.1 hypothetical protein EDD71_1214 [Fonticella tunisiensis]